MSQYLGCIRHQSLTVWSGSWPLRKQAYSNILKIVPPKEWKVLDKYSDIFHISAQNIDCGYPQSMFLSRNKKNNVYPCKPQFYYIKVGFKGVNIYRDVFVMFCSIDFTVSCDSISGQGRHRSDCADAQVMLTWAFAVHTGPEGIFSHEAACFFFLRTLLLLLLFNRPEH